MNLTLKYALMAAMLVVSTHAMAAGKARYSTNVSAAQARMNSLGYTSGRVDGILGEKTRAAIISFQRANGLKQTGSLDSETYALIGQQYNKDYDVAIYGYPGHYEGRYAYPYYNRTAYEQRLAQPRTSVALSGR